MTTIINDQAIREQALDINTSFIVQAPAGSGKTTLLIQRYLALLAQAKKPEEILAITFTRKAAAEMRHRILSALNQPDKNLNDTTATLARSVLDKDQQQGWQLLNNPERLRIQTIDSLCASICARLPLLSRFGIDPQITEDSSDLYRQAIEQLFRDFNDNPPWANALEYLLLHFDNRAAYLQNLLTSFLAMRDQWIPYVIPHHRKLDQLKLFLEKALKKVTLETLENIRKNFPRYLISDLTQTARAAAKNLLAEGSSHPITSCINLHELPLTTLDTMSQWLGLVNLLLTKEGTWRATTDKRIGILPKSNEKECLNNIIAALSSNESLRHYLYALTLVPPHDYSQIQWQTISALLQLLPIVLAQLQLVFEKNNAVDFVTLSQSALQALGEPDQPTDLALYFDYKIQHILIDEFQDTSITQFQLLQRLITGWQKNDGRTLFLVGDPMQSIYRFRNAEVSLFLHAQRNGIGTIHLESLILQTNFRSQEQLVDWVNLSFQNIFPKEPDTIVGAVPYSAAIAHDQSNNGRVEFHMLSHEKNNEAIKIIQLIKKHQEQTPEESIAILVRSRLHLKEIIKALQQYEITFQAVDIQLLSYQMEIQDLFSLTTALLNFGDQLAWLSILRAPWCGLSLKDLHCLTSEAQNKTIWQVLGNFENIENLSTDGKKYLNRIIPILKKILMDKGRYPLASWVKSAWIALGGPACLKQKNELNNTEAYFKLLTQWEQNETTRDLLQLKKQLLSLYAKPDAHANPHLQIMTIHKAKGLEFDHVIIPGLARQSSSDRNKLFLWHERSNEAGEIDLILGPLQAYKNEADPIYKYLKNIEKTKTEHETARLLYVATTRAKKSLHFVAAMEMESSDHSIKKPTEGSLLNLLWPAHQETIKQSSLKNKNALTSDAEILANSNLNIKRLSLDWQPFITTKEISQSIDNSLISVNTAKMMDIENRDAQILGTVIHAGLQNIAITGLPQCNRESIFELKSKWQMHLKMLGYSIEKLEQATDTVMLALCNTIEHDRGQWILSKEHLEAHNEYPISVVAENKIRHLVIDRCFVDSNEIRWIIDYKTSQPGELSLSNFLQLEKQRYQQQLSLYAHALYNIENRPTRLGLYFPLCQAWIEWEFSIDECY